MAEDIRSFQKNIAGKDNEIYDYLPAVSAVGDFRKISGIDVLVNSIRTLLLTPLGFYPFDPEYGSLLYRKVFDPLDERSKEEITFEVNQRVLRFDDRINISGVDVFPVGTDGKGYRVDVFIKRGGIKGKVTVNLPGPTGQFGLEG